MKLFRKEFRKNEIEHANVLKEMLEAVDWDTYNISEKAVENIKSMFESLCSKNPKKQKEAVKKMDRSLIHPWFLPFHFAIYPMVIYTLRNIDVSEYVSWVLIFSLSETTSNCIVGNYWPKDEALASEMLAKYCEDRDFLETFCLHEDNEIKEIAKELVEELKALG